MLKEQAFRLVKGEEETEIRNEAELTLKELGFSSYAAQTLVAIFTESPVSAGTLCQKTGIPDSKIYYALKEIEDAGLIIKMGGTPQQYAALDPKEMGETMKRLIHSQYEKKETMITRLEK